MLYLVIPSLTDVYLVISSLTDVYRVLSSFPILIASFPFYSVFFFNCRSVISSYSSSFFWINFLHYSRYGCYLVLPSFLSFAIASTWIFAPFCFVVELFFLLLILPSLPSFQSRSLRSRKPLYDRTFTMETPINVIETYFFFYLKENFFSIFFFKYIFHFCDGAAQKWKLVSPR